MMKRIRYHHPVLLPFWLQASSCGESVSTLGFGARVAEITLGQARANTECGAVFEARDARRRYECSSSLLTSGRAARHSQQASLMMNAAACTAYTHLSVVVSVILHQSQLEQGVFACAAARRVSRPALSGRLEAPSRW